MHFVILGQRPRPGEAAEKEPRVGRFPLEYDEYGRVLAPTIVPQDEAAWVGQGPVTDRTTEQRDKPMTFFRQRPRWRTRCHVCARSIDKRTGSRKA
jgi:hypothetical protein